MTPTAYSWLIFSLVLMFLETLIPGLVMVFLGISALFISLIVYLGYEASLLHLTTIWFVISLINIFTLRVWVSKLFPAKTTVSNMDEDLDACGKIVSVVQTVYTHNEEGRIFFRGTTWSAKCPQKTLEVGSKAKLVERHHNTWIVSPLD
jgi:membrane protein implicated in regulation of membrane protease activity